MFAVSLSRKFPDHQPVLVPYAGLGILEMVLEEPADMLELPLPNTHLPPAPNGRGHKRGAAHTPHFRLVRNASQPVPGKCRGFGSSHSMIGRPHRLPPI